MAGSAGRKRGQGAGQLEEDEVREKWLMGRGVNVRKALDGYALAEPQNIGSPVDKQSIYGVHDFWV